VAKCTRRKAVDLITTDNDIEGVKKCTLFTSGFLTHNRQRNSGVIAKCTWWKAIDLITTENDIEGVNKNVLCWQAVFSLTTDNEIEGSWQNVLGGKPLI
jgi:hypothetical protein